MRILLFFAFLFCFFKVNAQYQITGIVKEQKTTSPIPYATVAILKVDSSIVTGVATDEKGKFIIENIATGEYILRASYIGYQKAYLNVNVSSNITLDDIILDESPTHLKEVVVSSNRPFVQHRSDRYIVNVSGNIISSGRDALGILRNTPGVLVGAGGSISVMGKGIAVWIDGRPSHLSGDQLVGLLTSTPGESIDHIEVITNPSSRYDAEGLGGIINIRTIKGLQYGVNGSLIANYIQGHQDEENATMNLNYRNAKINYFGSYRLSRNGIWEKVEQHNSIGTENPVSFDQRAITKATKHTYRPWIRTGIDVFLNERNTFGVLAIADYSGGGIVNTKGETLIAPTLEGISFSNSNNKIKRKGISGQFNVNYQSTFSKPGDQLNIDIDYARFYQDPVQNIVNEYFDKNNQPIGITEQLRNTNPRTINIYSIKLDYSQSLWKNSRMLIGGKFNASKTDNDLKYEENLSEGWNIDDNRTNRFLYTEQVSAAYIDINQRLGKKVSLQAGLRGEYTYSMGEQKTTGNMNDSTYINLFPTFFMNYQMSQMHILGLSYSRRLNRPGFGQLNPFEVKIDAYSYTAGNPNLTPSYTNNLQLSYSFRQSFMARIAYSYSTDVIVQKPVANTVEGTYGIIPVNFGENQSIVLMANYRISPIKKWQLSVMGQAMYDDNRSGEISDGYKGSGTTFMFNLNNNISLTPDLLLEVSGMYYSKQRQGYMVMEPMGALSSTLRRSFLKDKLSIALTFNDILNTFITKVSAKYEGVDYRFKTQRDSRYFGINIRYNFGSERVKGVRNRNSAIEDETRRAN